MEQHDHDNRRRHTRSPFKDANGACAHEDHIPRAAASEREEYNTSVEMDGLFLTLLTRVLERPRALRFLGGADDEGWEAATRADRLPLPLPLLPPPPRHAGAFSLPGTAAEADEPRVTAFVTRSVRLDARPRVC